MEVFVALAFKEDPIVTVFLITISALPEATIISDKMANYVKVRSNTSHLQHVGFIVIEKFYLS